MDDNPGFDYSWSGFLDYISCYHELDPLWIVTGVCIFLGTGLSMVPQLVRLVRMRTSYGISPLFVTITHLGQFTTVLNIFALHNADFYGVTQITPARTLPRLLSFCSCFILWFTYLPVCVLMSVFLDKEEREKRKHDQIKKEHVTYRLGTLFITGSEIILFLPYMIIGCLHGFGSPQVLYYGKIVGIFSSVLSVCQYAPQFYTTCKLKDNGSFSIVTLAIQAPGGTTNAIFMMLGNKEHWTTWLAMLTSALQQFGLLALCIFYKCRAMRRRKMGVDGSALLGSDTAGGKSMPTVSDGGDGSFA